MRRRLGTAGLTALLVLALAACGDDKGDDAAATTTTESTTTTTVATTTTASTTTTTVPACPALTAPGETTGDSTGTADVDGDGKPDAVRGFKDASGWTIQVHLSTGGDAAVQVPDDSGTGIAVVGGHDVDGDGTQELWARVGAGASAQIVGLFWLHDCALAAVTLAGNPVQLPVGGSVGTASGVTCTKGADGANLAVHTLSNTDGDQYHVSTTTYAYANGTITEKATTEKDLSASSAEFQTDTSFSCGDLDV